MVSVKRFMQDEPALVDAIRKFICGFSHLPDPVVAVASRAQSKTAQVAWVLFGTAIYQDRDIPEIMRLLSAFYEAFPEEKLWTLPVPAAGAINDVVEHTFESRDWSMFEHVAGIFWSVGLFVRHHPDLVAWARERSPEEMWRDLGEIYFMGKAAVRPKACAAIYRIVSAEPLGLGVQCRMPEGSARKALHGLPPLPLTMGARRFLAMFSPAREEGFADLAPAQKQKLMDVYGKALCPEVPYTVAHSLQFFLEAGADDFVCRERTKRCAKCPLYEYCDYATRRSR
ncbi:hypothetical protein [Fibrobacter sp. UWT3]|uniref:hypothetical protein n=1 Tax=Fibrobacter sp. UWT3 TaxID=1896225 RepID=UPI000BE41002|nr:hypothetical protein [Fibrobacter sp. UWT3]